MVTYTTDATLTDSDGHVIDIGPCTVARADDGRRAIGRGHGRHTRSVLLMLLTTSKPAPPGFIRLKPDQ